MISPSLPPRVLSRQVDLLVPTKVTGVITQGAKDFGRVQFVGSYKVAYSNDGERWTVYQDEKQRKDKVRSPGGNQTKAPIYLLRLKATRYERKLCTCGRCVDSAF